MPNIYLSVLYKHIIQVEIKNVGLKVCVCVGGHKYTIAPQSKTCVCVCGGGGHMPPPPRLPTPVIYIYIYKNSHRILVPAGPLVFSLLSLMNNTAMRP